jgi:prephenate dehydratase
MKRSFAANQRIAFQGARGAFSEEAARRMLGEEARLVPCQTFEELFAAIDLKRADFLLAPIENSLAGVVVRVRELLRASRLQIIGEVTIPIAQHLIGCRNAEFERVREVMSHPVALAQCARFFAANPHLKKIVADDTAASVRAVCARGDQTLAAIGSEAAAEIYGGKVLRANVHDDKNNFTRFVLLAPVERRRLRDKLKDSLQIIIEPKINARSRVL